MTTYVQRYRNGEYEAVWAELRALGADIRLSDHVFRDAKAVADETMHRVRQNSIALITQLQHLKYTFTPFGTSYAPPDTSVGVYIQRIERTVGSMPLSVVSFMSLVGSVNLMGFFSQPDEYGNTWGQEVLPDPLVFMYPQSHFLASFQEWSTEVADVGIAEAGSFLLEFAPDEYHKADISGGAPYSIALPNKSIDACIEDAWHQTTFVSYLRECFRWGGFPGLQRASSPPRERIEMLTRNVLPF